jgi:hypothetical protein
MRLRRSNGELSDGWCEVQGRACQSGARRAERKIKLDANRQAIATTFITEVAELPNGELTNKFVKTVPDVNQTLGLDPATFQKIGLPSRTNPECKASY